MRVGFVHGVMNTDNMSILGLTIDYGPYGWLEGYDLDWTPNTTDAGGRRYRYGNQPQIAQWNLARLAEALLPLVPDKAQLEQGLDALRRARSASAWRAALAQKLGVAALDQPGDDALVSELFELLQAARDRLHDLLPQPGDADDRIAARRRITGMCRGRRSSAWLQQYQAQNRRMNPDAIERMNAVNPKYVFRNYLAQQAIDALENKATPRCWSG